MQSYTDVSKVPQSTERSPGELQRLQSAAQVTTEITERSPGELQRVQSAAQVTTEYRAQPR